MALNTGQIAPLLVPGLREIKGIYRALKPQWTRVFAVRPSKLQTERTEHVRYLGLPGLKNPGGQTNFDNAAGHRFTYAHTHTPLALGYSWTREAIDDNLYKAQFNPSNLGLIDSFRQMKEIIAADVFNTGNVYNTMIGGDGQALFSTAHPVDGFTIANTPTVQFGLNESSLLAAANQVRIFRDYAGLLKPAQARLLVVPVALRHVAMRLTETQKRPGTADNDVNALKEGGDFNQGYVVFDFLTSPYPWFVITDQGGLICLERTPFETSMQVDFTTDNLLVKGYERDHIGYDDWRAAYGVFPSN